MKPEEIKSLDDLKKLGIIPTTKRSQELIMGYIYSTNIQVYSSESHNSLKWRVVKITNSEGGMDIIEYSKGAGKNKKVKDKSEYKEMEEIEKDILKEIKKITN
ncbi:MAG: hypothetical protein LBM99_01745 [Bacillales bacterium]|jgi:hypothetical protein|nr:hypothetical protein [Bacillales bacterium]